MPARDDDDYDDRPRRRYRDDDDYDDEDDRPRRRRGAPQTNGIATSGLVVGILSLVCMPLLAPVALLLSGIGLARAGSRGGAGQGQAIGGLVTGGLALIIGIPIMIGILLPAVQKVREAASRQKQSNNFKMAALGALNYESATNTFPVAVARDPAAAAQPDPNAAPDPSTRLGWRADLLPYIEQGAMYKALDFGKAWNSPANSSVTNMSVPVYADPADGPPTAQTRMRGFTGNGAIFDPDPKHKVTVAAVADGLSNTILYVDATQTVSWAQNNELPFTPTAPLPPLGHPSRNVFLAAMGDGSVRVVRKDANPAVIRAAITYNGGETLFLDW